MKKQLVVQYKNGAKTTITHDRCEDNNIFKTYLEQAQTRSITSAVLFTYPMSAHSALILIKNGKTVNSL